MLVGWVCMYVLLTTYGYMDLQHTSGVIMSRDGEMRTSRQTVRIPESLLTELRQAAQENGWTLNAEIVFRLKSGCQVAVNRLSNGDQTAVERLSGGSQMAVKRLSHDVVDPLQESATPLDAILEADGMDDSGDIARRDSPAQARRKAQIEAVQAAWSELFPNQTVLQAQRAKVWLQLSGDCAEDIWKVMEATAGRDDVRSPVGYIEGTLKKLKEKRDTERAKDAELEADWELAKTAAMNDPQWGGWTEADRKWAE